MTDFRPTTLLTFLMFFVTGVEAKVSTEQAARLGQDLTPFGAIKKGDEPAGIPAWQDVKTTDPSEQVLFTITHDNYLQHEKHLTAGQIALFQTHPETFKMSIYPSHRTFAAPDWVYNNSKNNAITAELNPQKTGILNATGGIPFPIPQSALEVYFNHVARWRGVQLINHASDANVAEDGSFQLSSRESLIRYDYYLNDNPNPNRLFSAISKTTAPASRSGTGGLVIEPLDQIDEPRSAWLWDKGRRRVTRAPNFAYDQPISSANALRTADDTDMVNGAPDRFEWQLLEPRTVYIPYNNNRLADTALPYTDILKPGHINPALTRYEKHRVWVIRGTVKSEWRHLYSRRDFYIDEDSWSIAIADQYDKQGQLFRVSMAYLQQDPNMPGTFPVITVFHDLNSRKYHVMGLQNEAPKGNIYDAKLANDNIFTPNGLKRYVK
ncbi:DUF1329 domain-containing protein [Marinicella litoralis]|nr:DUF1329 domain-containing protein [Marinicella litoralis]